MRVELYGCPWNDGIVSYSMPQGDKRGNWEFFDATYDGHWDGELRRGLGQLTDGRTGPDNFKMGYYDSDRGQGWVGWRNDSRSSHPLEIKFEFDHVREFSAVHIFCNNQFTKDVQVTIFILFEFLNMTILLIKLVIYYTNFTDSLISRVATSFLEFRKRNNKIINNHSF